jgi:glycosyltransferase involved in cell wall biosynthesis
MRHNTLYIVVPCYNEEAVLPETARRLKAKLASLQQSGQIGPNSRVLFVDDGSKDATWSLISDLTAEDSHFGGLKLAHNAGHQFALLAGLTAAHGRADMVISLDADLQDDIEAIDDFVDAYHTGADVVYGVRSSRETDTRFKRGTAEAFYKLMGLLGADIVRNHADYRLLSARALAALLEFEEADLFLRGVVPLLGFNTATVPYVRHERFAGESKYPLKKMLAFALDGILSFSVQPLRLITGLGILIFVCSVIALFYLLILKLSGNTVEGWATLMGSIWAIGGIQLLCLGVTGEYVGRIYKQVKKRPRFIVEALTLTEKQEVSL